MSLIKNSSWNIVGYAIPAIFAIPALGFIARSLGTELFGVFTLALAIVGYASIFDAGLTRAVTREIALCTNGEENKKKYNINIVMLLAHFGRDWSVNYIFVIVSCGEDI